MSLSLQVTLAVLILCIVMHLIHIVYEKYKEGKNIDY